MAVTVYTQPRSERRLQDATYSIATNCPIAANQANSNTVDLGHNAAYPIQEKIRVKLSVAATTGSANNKNVNIWLQHSNEAAANFVNIAQLAIPMLQITDNNGAGAAAANTDNIYLPADTRRYVRCVAKGEANGGDVSAAQFTMDLYF